MTDLVYEDHLGTLRAWAGDVCIAIIDRRSNNVAFIDRLHVRHNTRLSDAKRVIQDRISRPHYLRLLTEAEDSAGLAWPRRCTGCQS